MTAYSSPAQLVGGTTDPAGVTVVEGTDMNDASSRLPSFLALAKYTGGRYAEQIDGMTVPQALAAAGLDFTVVKHAGLSVQDGERVITGLPRMRGTVAHYPDDRAPTLLGIVGQGYEVVQPIQAAEFGQAVLEEGGATVAAVGAYGDPIGSRMFMALRLPEGLLIGGEDPYNLYLGIGNSWNRTTGLWAVTAPIRIDCTNQAAAIFGGMSNRFSIRHTADVATKVGEVQRALELTGTFSERYATWAEMLLSEPMDGAEVDTFLDKLMPTPKTVKTSRGEANWAGRRGAIGHVIRSGGNNTVGRGTRYAAYQGVVEWVDHFSPSRTPAARATRLLDGGAYEQIKYDAARLLTAGL